jgi:hypothetical protein
MSEKTNKFKCLIYLHYPLGYEPVYRIAIKLMDLESLQVQKEG